MTRRSKIWLALALLFLVVNLGGGIYAAVVREGPHAGLHAALALLGAYLVWRLVRSGRARPEGDAAVADVRPALGDRLAQLELSVDSIAVEVGRVGEGQRHIERLLVDDEKAVKS